MILFHNVAHSVNHILHLFIGHGGVQRQGDNAVEVLLCHREVAFLPAELLIRCHGVRRNEVHARPDPQIRETLYHLVAV